MRIKLPEGLSKKELQQFLIQHKSAIIQKKRAGLIKSDPFVHSGFIVTDRGEIKAQGKEDDESNTDPFGVKVVANSAWWADSYMDVLTDTCYDKSVKEKGILIPHIKNHAWDDCTSHVGDVQAVYTQLIPLKDLGVNKAGKTTCLIFETKIRNDYDEKVYRFYKNKKINQHSIGLYYVQIELAIDYEDSEKEYDFWKKYIDRIINKDAVVEAGYFWLVSEIKLIENSCVLFGANELTPTLEIFDAKSLLVSTEGEPDLSTHSQPNNNKTTSIDYASLI